jgi:hypothetical protein
VHLITLTLFFFYNLDKEDILAKHLYVVEIDGGRNNKNWQIWYVNIVRLGAKQIDYGGIKRECVISHHIDNETLHSLCTESFNGGEGDVTVTEITRNSLRGKHRGLTEMVNKYYLPHGKYPNIKETEGLE